MVNERKVEGKKLEIKKTNSWTTSHEDKVRGLEKVCLLGRVPLRDIHEKWRW